MYMRTILFFAAVVSLCAISALAQSCPTIKTTGPVDVLKQGAPMMFTASVKGGDPKVRPTFNWTISTGTITSGQGTSSITVGTADVYGTVTATVEVGGYDRNCSTSSSFSSDIQQTPAARQVDEFGPLVLTEVNAKLDAFFIELQNDPTATGYVIAYSTKEAPMAATAVLKKATSQARVRNIDPTRFKTVDGGMKNALLVQLWIVPEGAPAPKIEPAKPQAAKPPVRKTT